MGQFLANFTSKIRPTRAPVNLRQIAAGATYCISLLPNLESPFAETFRLNLPISWLNLGTGVHSAQHHPAEDNHR